MVWCFLWNSNLYYTAARGPDSTRETVSQMPLLTARAKWYRHGPWMTWRTARMLNTCLYHSRHGPGSAERLPKKQIAFYYSLVWRPARLRSRLTHSPLLGSLTLGEQHMHIYTRHTHVHNPLVRTARSTHTLIHIRFTYSKTELYGCRSHLLI